MKSCVWFLFILFWHIPLILVFYAAFYWRIYLFSSNRRWIDTHTINRYYRSCWLPIASFYRLKIFHFWPIVSIIGPKKKFSSIKSNHRLKIFFSSKDHRSNRCFLQLIDYQYQSNQCFFRHRCPSVVASLTTPNIWTKIIRPNSAEPNLAIGLGLWWRPHKEKCSEGLMLAGTRELLKRSMGTS